MAQTLIALIGAWWVGSLQAQWVIAGGQGVKLNLRGLGCGRLRVSRLPGDQQPEARVRCRWQHEGERRSLLTSESRTTRVQKVLSLPSLASTHEAVQDHLA
ncbi:hypothetical protein BX600DRAFT_430792 [Xylariales sp. PMI_506]|nr:hypothetical protein BX600DRAFT_430792 [Xylariales sp. PMI_506]